MESCRVQQDFFQNETLTASGLGQITTSTIGLNLGNQSFLPTEYGTPFFEIDPVVLPAAAYSMYNASTSQLYTNPPQPTMHNSMYNSTFPYHTDCNELCRDYTVAGQLSSENQRPPRYPQTLPDMNYSQYSPIYESPVSSPESLLDIDIDYFANIQNSLNFGSQSSLVQPPSPLVDHNMNGHIASSTSASPTMMNYTDVQRSYPVMDDSDNQKVESNCKPSRRAIQMPQRKGGIQLWQFLYGLLMDSQHSNLIEWTSNRHVYEFRLLEPESIAVWWGTLKNKRAMTYDKFSQSLRYYYHKGILKKIPGERYVYRFLVDPEDMYKHIGTSDKRPAIKAMPKEAKMVMSMFQRKPTFISDNELRLPIVTEPPETHQLYPCSI